MKKLKVSREIKIKNEPRLVQVPIEVPTNIFPYRFVETVTLERKITEKDKKYVISQEQELITPSSVLPEIPISASALLDDDEPSDESFMEEFVEIEEDSNSHLYFFSEGEARGSTEEKSSDPKNVEDTANDSLYAFVKEELTDEEPEVEAGSKQRKIDDSMEKKVNEEPPDDPSYPSMSMILENEVKKVEVKLNPSVSHLVFHDGPESSYESRQLTQSSSSEDFVDPSELFYQNKVIKEESMEGDPIICRRMLMSPKRTIKVTERAQSSSSRPLVPRRSSISSAIVKYPVKTIPYPASSCPVNKPYPLNHHGLSRRCRNSTRGQSTSYNQDTFKTEKVDVNEFTCARTRMYVSKHEKEKSKCQKKSNLISPSFPDNPLTLLAQASENPEIWNRSRERSRFDVGRMEKSTENGASFKPRGRPAMNQEERRQQAYDMINKLLKELNSRKLTSEEEKKKQEELEKWKIQWKRARVAINRRNHEERERKKRELVIEEANKAREQYLELFPDDEPTISSHLELADLPPKIAAERIMTYKEHVYKTGRPCKKKEEIKDETKHDNLKNFRAKKLAILEAAKREAEFYKFKLKEAERKRVNNDTD